MSHSSAKSLADVCRVTLSVAINRSPKNLTGKHARGLRRFRFAAERRHYSPPKPAAKRALAQFHGPTRILMQAFGSLAHLTLSRNLAKPTILNDSELPGSSQKARYNPRTSPRAIRRSDRIPHDRCAGNHGNAPRGSASAAPRRSKRGTAAPYDRRPPQSTRDATAHP